MTRSWLLWASGLCAIVMTAWLCPCLCSANPWSLRHGPAVQDCAWCWGFRRSQPTAAHRLPTHLSVHSLQSLLPFLGS